jgi:uncharacterized integral membrane protein
MSADARGRPFPIRLTLAVVALALALLLVLQNQGVVTLHLLLWEAQVSLVILTLSVAVLGYAAGFLTARYLSRRRGAADRD